MLKMAFQFSFRGKMCKGLVLSGKTRGATHNNLFLNPRRDRVKLNSALVPSHPPKKIGKKTCAGQRTFQNVRFLRIMTSD